MTAPYDVERGKVPSVLLFASGALQVLFGIWFLFVAGLSLLSQTVLLAVHVMMVLDSTGGGDEMFVLLFTIWQLVLEGIGALIWATLTLGAFYPLRSGVLLWTESEDFETIRQGTAIGLAIPVAWFAFGVVICCLQLDVIGVLFGSLPAVMMEFMAIIPWVLVRNLETNGPA